MQLYSIPSIQKLIPECEGLLKSASLEENIDHSTADKTLATGLHLHYQLLTKSAGVTSEDLDLQRNAENLWRVTKQAEDLRGRLTEEFHKSFRSTATHGAMVKEAQANQATFGSKLCGVIPDFNALTNEAKALHKQAQDLGIDVSPEVEVYSGNGYVDRGLLKQALHLRSELAGPGLSKYLTKLANTVPTMAENMDTVVLNTIHSIDMEAGLNSLGFNIYKEACMTKAAAVSALTIKVDGSLVPYEKLQALGRTKISAYLGEDIAKEFDKDPVTFKQVIETLPLDMQKILSNLLKSV